MKLFTAVLIFVIIFLSSFTSMTVFGHQSDCHKNHSCPSDTGKYVCGDLGNCSQCPDNNYCKAGQPNKKSKTESTLDSPQDNTRHCTPELVCFIQGDYLKYHSFINGNLDWETIFEYAGSYDQYKIAIHKNDTSYDPQIEFLVGNKWTKTVLTLVDLDVRTGLNAQAAIGSACCYNYYYILPSPVSIDRWLHSESADYWKDKVKESTYDYEGIKRDVIIINENTNQQIIDKKTGILLFIKTKDEITKLVDTNIIQKNSNSKKIEETLSIQQGSNRQEIKKQNQCLGTALCITGKVKKIIDGDTIIVEKSWIRLSLTNTPEKGQKGFNEATAFTSKLCPYGSTVTVDQDDKRPTDKYKRIVGKVTCSGKILNSELLYNGHANILTNYCKTSEFSTEDWAKKYGC